MKRLPKGAPDRALAAASRAEGRVIVTNDGDFARSPAGTIFAVVLLRIPQRDGKGLLAAFGRLLSECRRWEGQAILLHAARWSAAPLAVAPSRQRHAA